MAENNKNSRKSFAILGFILSIISLGGYYFAGNMANIEAITTGGGTIVMLLWALLCATAFLLCFSTIRRASAGTKGLAKAGMIISVFTFLMSIWSAIIIYQAASNPELEKLRQRLETNKDDELDKLNRRLDHQEKLILQEKDSI